MNELKIKYNTLLEKWNKGNEYLKQELTEEEQNKAVEKLDKIRGEMDKILMELEKAGEVLVPYAMEGFPVEVAPVVEVKKVQQAPTNNNEMVVSYIVDNQEIVLTPDVVQNYIVGEKAGKITKQEFMMFASLCQARKLNPFLKEAYCIKYSNTSPATIVVGKDAIIKRAALHPQYDGMKSGIIVTNTNNEIIERKGTFKLPNETLVGAWAEVFRKDWENSIYCSVTLEEVIQRKADGKANTNWVKQPAMMAEKVAKVRALREAFVEELGGMYYSDEINMNAEKPQYEEVEDVL